MLKEFILIIFLILFFNLISADIDTPIGTVVGDSCIAYYNCSNGEQIKKCDLVVNQTEEFLEIKCECIPNPEKLCPDYKENKNFFEKLFLWIKNLFS